ncbi:MAG: hypothetical protein DME25_10720 [Verrucomicrobia bacterium]|nr:MAG: hypothetical protein DME25_10720 [Verrucomicrobiota bacterium]
MNASLEAETERLTRSWTRHEAAMLRDYLVASVEDPRLNLQSVLTRHFLVRALTGERFGALMDAEGRFAAVMNWLVSLAGRVGQPEDLSGVLYAVRRRADNIEGLEIPHFVRQTFAALPAAAGDLTVPNYIEDFLSGTEFVSGQVKLHEPSLETFRGLWRDALAAEFRRTQLRRRWREEALRVLEPAGGSANDYRFLEAYGLARLVDYTGFDLCSKNVENARALFPTLRFDVGNVFDIAASDKAFDLCFVHDLFEHLSPEGLQTAVAEICRVTRLGLCIGFFNMDEIPDHVIRPVEEYHWNTLSMARMKELFQAQEFEAQVIHIGTFLRQRFGCEHTHNSNAYTFILGQPRA